VVGLGRSPTPPTTTDTTEGNTTMADDPIRDEAEGIELASIDWRGETLYVPADPDEWTLDAIEAFESGKQLEFARALLTPADFAKMRAVTPKVRDFKEFMDLLAQRLGFGDAGESPASSR
jgi:hypothetical protein